MRIHLSGRQLALLLTAVLLGFPLDSGARHPRNPAKGPAVAARLLRLANKQCASDRPEAALPLYQKALRVRPLPGIHLAYGDCLRQVGRCDQAIEQYRRFLERARGRRNREQGEALISLCQQQVKEQAAPVGLTVAPARKATVRRPAARKATTRRATDRQATERPLALEPARPTQAARPVVVPPPGPPRRRLPAYYFWAGVGITAAMVVVGTASGALALQRSAAYKDVTTTYYQMQALKDSGEALKLTSNISFAVAGATAAATTVLFFFTRFKATEAVRA
jgi:tetratricopeptide (TPR) repeat protein